MTLRVLSNRKNHELCARVEFLFHFQHIYTYVHIYQFSLSSEENMEMIVNFIY